MKKLYSLITLMLCVSLFGAKAYAQTTTEDIPLTFCVNVSDPDICYALNANWEEVTLQKGENVFTTVYHKTTYTDGTSYGYSDAVTLIIKQDYSSDYTFTACSVKLAGATETSAYDDFYGPSNSIAFYVVPDMDGCVFTPTIANLAALRTASATVNVDDASNVKLVCGFSGYAPELVNGENIIKFNPEDEANWEIGTREYNTHLGGVTLNGEEVLETYGAYYLTVTDGSVIDIVGKAEIVPVNVSFSFVNEGTEAAVVSVSKYENYEPVEIENWKDGFTVDKYTEIIVSLDLNLYNVKSMTINGTEQELYSENVYITLTDDTKIVIDAEKYSTFDFTLTVTDPAHLDIGVAASMYSGMTALTGLVSGTQTVTVSDRNTYLIVSPISGCAIDRVYYVKKGSTEENDVEAGYSGYYVPLTDTESVTIESHAKTRESTATLWINDIDLCYVFSMKYADSSYIFDTYGDAPAAVTGSQTFNFNAEEDNPIWFFYSAMDYENPGYVMLNEEVLEPLYEGTTTYEVDVKDGDVIKVYIGETDPNASINNITTDAVENIVYNLQGIRVVSSKLTPGIYIINGKKVLVK